MKCIYAALLSSLLLLGCAGTSADVNHDLQINAAIGDNGQPVSMQGAVSMALVVKVGSVEKQQSFDLSADRKIDFPLTDFPKGFLTASSFVCALPTTECKGSGVGWWGCNGIVFDPDKDMQLLVLLYERSTTPEVALADNCRTEALAAEARLQ
jgi:hypothetical protein